ncbi:betaine-aldehyde dehydrogenase [Marinomonas ushuaiensis DSM 15871]|uniref:Betaine-aldehyde dehydrogenase n=1 Tax=Marinomonas ushuaiensis DSM 15871 TaxID=1122207 RepID=X7E3D5_9GAMM|nr:aldehyde dehydrogenase family protein [Marinomonas ushuaiensis]ETX09688.1 betaine-aldehyde dehydrogenase [Marinomonas ushuaiensis DSM 15871]
MTTQTIIPLAWAKDWLTQPKNQYINGEWVKGENLNWDLKNPANGESLCQIPLASSQQVEATAVIANQHHEAGTWSKVSRTERANLLRAIATLIRNNVEKLALLETLPNGKLFSESMTDDIPTCADIFDYYAGWTDKYYGETSPVDKGFLNYTLKEPIGVCALIAPWNFPLYQASLKIAPALAMGNIVIIKPSEYTPLTTVFLMELIDEALNIPAGVINMLLTDGASANQLTLSHNVHKVSFTGSTDIGRRIVQNSGQSNLKSTTLELGGKSPCIFFEDAPDLDGAIDRAFTVMFSHKGEKCSEPTRFIIHSNIYDYVLDKLITKAEAIKCGNPLSADVDQGPQCNEVQFNKIMEYIKIGKSEARLVTGGYADTEGENAKGYFIRPTIFADVAPDARIAQEEIFGPVLSCIRFDTTEEAISIANGTEYGLAAGLYTANVSRAHKVAEQLDSGMLFINRYGCYGLAAPFGGFKQSGWGKEMAIHSLSSYTKTKGVWVYYGDA